MRAPSLHGTIETSELAAQEALAKQRHLDHFYQSAKPVLKNLNNFIRKKEKTNQI